MGDSIDVTGCDLRALIAKAYELSRPNGLGWLQHTPGPLPETVIDSVLALGNQRYPVSMDYVVGRSIKLAVRRTDDGRLLIPYPYWHDHTTAQLVELATAIGAKLPETAQ